MKLIKFGKEAENKKIMDPNLNVSDLIKQYSRGNGVQVKLDFKETQKNIKQFLVNLA